MWSEEYDPESCAAERPRWYEIVTLVLICALVWAAIIKGLIVLDSRYGVTGWALSAMGRLP